MDEIWRPVAQYPDYDVSNLGRVRSRKRAVPRILNPWSHNSGGYPAVKLSRRGEPQRSTLVHQIVCETFNGPRPSPKHEVAHWDGDSSNSRADNLRWALGVENCADKLRHGTHFNSGQFKSKLTDDNVREVRRLIAAGWTQSRIAERFGVWQGCISGIHVGRTRKHVV